MYITYMYENYLTVFHMLFFSIHLFFPYILQSLCIQQIRQILINKAAINIYFH